MKEPKTYQIYLLHLIGGDIIEVPELYKLPFEKGIVEKIQKSDKDDFITVGNAVDGFAYIPVRNIVYVSTGDVRESWF